MITNLRNYFVQVLALTSISRISQCQPSPPASVTLPTCTMVISSPQCYAPWPMEILECAMYVITLLKLCSYLILFSSVD